MDDASAGSVANRERETCEAGKDQECGRVEQERDHEGGDGAELQADLYSALTR
jgi:hypothetical protein